MRTILVDGPAKNALGTDLMARLLEEVRAGGGEPLLLTGAGDAFSAGLDLKEVQAADTAAMRRFHHLLEALIGAVYHYPGPVAAAVNGHAIAGGAILALVADHRVLTSDPRARVGLNEVALGLRFPPRLLAWVTDCIPRRHHAEVLLGAGLFAPAEALRVGLVDAVADDPVAEASAWLERVARHPDDSYAAAKAQLRPEVRLSAEEEARFEREVLPRWTSPAIKSRIAAFFRK